MHSDSTSTRVSSQSHACPVRGFLVLSSTRECRASNTSPLSLDHPGSGLREFWGRGSSARRFTTHTRSPVSVLAQPPRHLPPSERRHSQVRFSGSTRIHSLESLPFSPPQAEFPFGHLLLVPTEPAAGPSRKGDSLTKKTALSTLRHSRRATVPP